MDNKKRANLSQLVIFGWKTKTCKITKIQRDFLDFFNLVIPQPVHGRAILTSMSNETMPVVTTSASVDVVEKAPIILTRRPSLLCSLSRYILPTVVCAPKCLLHNPQWMLVWCQSTYTLMQDNGILYCSCASCATF